MKTRPLQICSLLGLLLLTGGCLTQSYGPYSPDYFPRTTPPFRDSSTQNALPRTMTGEVHLGPPLAVSTHHV